MNINKISTALTVFGFFVFAICSAQAPDNWFNLDYEKDGVRGVSTERVYDELVGQRKSQTVVVAVIDSGVDEAHEDLKDIMWVNRGEIPNNGKDDDNNGYVDDIHGWNFLGGKNGKNVSDETLEVTRVYAHLRKKYGSREDLSGLSKKEKKEYERFKKAKAEVDKKRQEAEAEVANFKITEQRYMEGLSAAKELLGDLSLTEDNLSKVAEKVDAANPSHSIGMYLLETAMNEGMTLEEVEKEVTEQLTGAKDYYGNQANYYYNPDWNPRKDIIGDDYANSYESGYGNNDVKGPDASHGTHVAGIIGAVRDNDLGMKGVADNVRIMSIRAVPDGDEHDKDVANAIRYAVDNGASVVNMSFGKGWAWDKKAVDDAVKYANKHDVLLVHAAGNSSQENDFSNNYPNDRFNKKGLFQSRYAKNWIEVGALSWQKAPDASAEFSNYSAEIVDLFAPGVDIYSTVPDVDAYKANSGTSMASPVVAGVASLIRSYFPELTALQVKAILMESVVPVEEKVYRPGTEEEVNMKELCRTGGVVNAYKAFQLAAKTKGKKKIKKDRA